jgi:filamentous hemagglutinin family protein
MTIFLKQPVMRKIAISSLMTVATSAQAEAVFDGSMRPDTQGLTLDGHFEIGAKYGQQQGGNLFHSFQRFNINTGESATFTGPDTGPAVSNVISRVTGSSLSNIDGTLRSTIPNADVYLINPRGIMFGPNASLDVQGSFHATTADYLRLGNEGSFHASVPEKSTLISAPPAAFGFLGNNPAAITVKGEEVTLKVPTTKDLSLIGGKIELEDSVLHAPSGRINIAAVSSAGEVVPTSSDLQVSSADKGEIKLSHFSQKRQGQIGYDGNPIIVYGSPVEYANLEVTNYENFEGTGQIFIRGGKFFLDRAWIFADTFFNETEQKSRIDIAIDGDMELTRGARITAANFFNSQGGRITIKADALRLSGQSMEFPGFLNNLSTIATNNYGDGTGGDIQIDTPILELTPGAIFSISAGDSGNIDITATEVTLREGGLISTNNLGFGHPGNITINADNISLSQGYYGSIAAAADSPYSTGAGDIILNTSALSLTDKGIIYNRNVGEGNAGSINITTHTALLTGQSDINTNARNAGGGYITLNVRDSLELYDDSRIMAQASGDKPEDKGGNIIISKPQLLVLDKSQILAGAKGGDGGTIEINAAHFIASHPFEKGEKILFEDIIFARTFRSRINASSEFGEPGDIWINASQEDISDDLVRFSRKFTEHSILLNRCEGLTRKELSRFLVIGREQLPTAPGDLKNHLYIPQD